MHIVSVSSARIGRMMDEPSGSQAVSSTFFNTSQFRIGRQMVMPIFHPCYYHWYCSVINWISWISFFQRHQGRWWWSPFASRFGSHDDDEKSTFFGQINEHFVLKIQTNVEENDSCCLATTVSDQLISKIGWTQTGNKEKRITPIAGWCMLCFGQWSTNYWMESLPFIFKLFSTSSTF